MISPPKSNRMRMQPHSNVKYTFGGFLKLGLAIVFLLGLIILVLSISTVSKEPATVNQVEKAIIEQGYNPRDISNAYYEKDYSFESNLLNCIAFQQLDIHFEFFNFTDNSSAENIYRQAYKDIIATNHADNRRTGGTKLANYSIYTLEKNEKYYVAIYVENTAVYAYCNSRNKDEINAILSKIDYLTP